MCGSYDCGRKYQRFSPVHTGTQRCQLELDDMIEQFMKDEDVDTPDNIGTYRYEDILGTTFKLVNASDYYSYDSEYKVWKDKSDNNKYNEKTGEKTGKT